MRGPIALVVVCCILAGFMLSEAGATETNKPYGSLLIHPRIYYINREFVDLSKQESLAVGGWVDYKTPTLYGLSLGFAWYTSQPFLIDDPDKGGGEILLDNQQGYDVLGQSYLQGVLGGTTLRLYRQIFDTPFINSFDVKMTPQTMEAYTLEQRSLTNTLVMVSHVTKLKTWTATSFQSMSEVAGYAGTDEPVTFGGIILTPPQISLQIWNYYAHEYFNNVYAQIDYPIKFDEKTQLTLSAQGLHQDDVGDAIGGKFSAGMLGAQAALMSHGISLILATTATDSGEDIVNPWAAYPGFTSIIEDDNDHSKEDAATLGIGYDFEYAGIPGLTAFFYNTASYKPHIEAKDPDQWEHDILVDYHFPGVLKGLWFKIQIAILTQDENLGGQDVNDYRLVLNYDFFAL